MPHPCASLGQNQGSLGSAGISNNFYFAYTKKGGALGNFPVQIAKIHETILNLVSNNEAQNLGGQPGLQDSGQGSYYQYKNLSNAALRTLSRLIKLDLL